MKRIFCLLALWFCLAASPARAAYDIYMQINGMSGESTATGRSGWIDVYSFSHGISKASPVGGGVGTVPNHAEFSIAKRLDKTSLPLDTKVNTGATISTIIVEFSKNTGGSTPLTFYRVTFTNARITSVTSSGSGGEDSITENIGINYDKIAWEYTPTDPSTGKAGTKVTAEWDVVNNTGK